MAKSNVQGGTANQRVKLQCAIDACIERLGWGDSIRWRIVARPAPDEDSQAHAGSRDGNNWVVAGFVSKGSTQQLARASMEELAHAYLGSLGVPHDITPAVLIQEAFAVWVVGTSYGLDNTRLPQTAFDWVALPNNITAYIAGSYLGASWALADGASEALDEWELAEPPAQITDPEREFLALTTQALRRYSLANVNPLDAGKSLSEWYSAQSASFGGSN